jgi:chromosome segregation protein
MRLNRLEIAGFKSFPDRSELTFDNGVTAIVGPNGCGKSNVVDALTWVLGEQSAKSLRGDRMEDVIFGGSDARKPTAAAEVRLRLSGVAARGPSENGNGHSRSHSGPAVETGAALLSETGTALALEDDVPLIVRDVELMRRLYRSGESEYPIDGATCRLRTSRPPDGFRLGVKAYAVIEQGKIGQILSARPTDRRQLIEEAAGVTKYKSRRRAAELKLEAAQQNLTRVDDIVYEVEKQRGALKRQAAKARRYRRLREELRRWEKVQFARRYRLLGEAIEAARARLTDARIRETSAAVALSELETTLERLRLELTTADASTTAAREAAHASELENGRLQQQVAFDRHQIEQLAAAAIDIEASPGARGATRACTAGARVEERGRVECDHRSARGRRHPGCRRGRVCGCSAPHRGARGRRRGGAQRSLRSRQCSHRAAPRDGALERGEGADPGATGEAGGRRSGPASRSVAGRAGSTRRGRRNGAGARGSRDAPHRPWEPRVGADWCSLRP